MLGLTRKSGESIVIGVADGQVHEVRVTVLEIRGGIVRLGIEADHNIAIVRSELAFLNRSNFPRRT